MNAPQGPAAPASGIDDIPTFEELAADPEIGALLDFRPVPRQLVKADGWTPNMQRMFIAWLPGTARRPTPAMSWAKREAASISCTRPRTPMSFVLLGTGRSPWPNGAGSR